MKNPYEVLGVERVATDEEIKAAYKRAAFHAHSDRNGSTKEAEERAKEINLAYDALKPEVRALTDAMLDEQAAREAHEPARAAPTPQQVAWTLLRAYASGGDAAVLDRIFQMGIAGMPEERRPVWEVVRALAVEYVRRQNRLVPRPVRAPRVVPQAPRRRVVKSRATSKRSTTGKKGGVKR
jgi:DnaJ-class molecular chaperone